MKIDLTVSTLFAEFQDLVFARSALASKIKSTPSYVKKIIKKQPYWYTQEYVQKKMIQRYSSPAHPTIDAQILKTRIEKKQDQVLLQKMLSQESRQAGMLRRGGLPALDVRLANVVSLLSDAKLIDGHGILIGSLAFQAYAGMLGACFDKATLRTNDIDIVFDLYVKVISRAPVDLNALLKNSDLGFRAVPAFDHHSLPSSFIGDHGIRVDLLSPQVSKPTGTSSLAGITGACSITLPFLDILTIDPHRTILIGPKGGIPVTVPAPHHFALHKLIVATRRPLTESAKMHKDIHQASALLNLLLEQDRQEVRKIWKSLINRGPKWKKALHSALKLLPQEQAELLK